MAEKKRVRRGGHGKQTFNIAKESGGKKKEERRSGKNGVKYRAKKV